VTACDRVGVVSQWAWQQLELSVSNVTDTETRGQTDLQQTAGRLLSLIRDIVERTRTDQVVA